jgi:hypothetical protein
MKIFLDDHRKVADVYGESGYKDADVDASGWTIVRTLGEFKRALDEYENDHTDARLVISFDHDLHPGQTGMDCAKLLASREIVPTDYYVHSANPVGANNIRQFMENWKQHAAMDRLTEHSQKLGRYDDGSRNNRDEAES